ncbi:hypothetical protein LX36DRAFT_715361 [Colletotrichum falcatum]|nr:hypothetical protein LX36DRAFT_715361 [Colletotrichum falcatum]
MESIPREEAVSGTAVDAVKNDVGVLSSVERDDVSSREPEAPARTARKLDVLIQGVALFSDGYNIQIIGYMNTVLAKLNPKQMTNDVKTRLSISILIGDIFGMAAFRALHRQGIVIATAAHGVTVEGMFWMMVIGRGVAGVGAGGEYTVCTSQALECADSTEAMRRRRGMLVAVSTNASIISGFVGSSIVPLIVIAAYRGEPHDGIWRICFGIGIFVGAAVGTTALGAALASFDDKLKGQQAIFLIGSGISVVGTACVWFLVLNAPEHLEDEDLRFNKYLEANGYDTNQMGLKA